MFIIVTYDVETERVNKVRKILRKHLCWVQNSVFEGELTVSQLANLKLELKRIIKDGDSIYFYKVEFPKALKKEILGENKGLTGEFL